MIKRSLAIAAMTLLLAAPATAQPDVPCDPRIVIGGAASFMRADIPVDPVLATGGRFGSAEATGLGFEGSVHTLLPISYNWRVLAEFGTGSMDVLVKRDASRNEVNRKTGDDISLRRLQVGLMRYDTQRLGCLYWLVRAGVYQFAYRGASLNAGGVSGAIGVEVPVSDAGAVFFEMEVNAVVTKERPPVTPAGILANLRPAFGFRYRF